MHQELKNELFDKIYEYFNTVKKIIKEKPKKLENMEKEIDTLMLQYSSEIDDDCEFYADRLTKAENRIKDLEEGAGKKA